MTGIIQIIAELEAQDFHFAPRRENGLDKFDYEPPRMLTNEQSQLIRCLKKDEAGVCRLLVDRAGEYLHKMRAIVEAVK